MPRSRISAPKHFERSSKSCRRADLLRPRKSDETGAPVWRKRQMGKLGRIEGELKQKLLELRG